MREYRDVLLFPKFSNSDYINNIRRKYDKLYDAVDYHITVIFPFKDDISDHYFINQLRELLKSEKKFFVKFSGD